MEPKDTVVLIVGILVFVASLLNIGIAIWRESKRMPVQNAADKDRGALDRANAIETLQDIVDKQAEEDKKLRGKIDDLTRRLADVERKRTGPFVLQLEFLTSPEPVVTKAELKLLPGTGPLKPLKDEDATTPR